MDIRIIDNTVSFLDYMPHIIAAISITSTMVITYIQYKTSVETHRKNSNFDAKKEAIEEALDFLDICISYRKTDSLYQSLNIPMSDAELTERGRRVHNKLCLTCENKDIVDCFMKIVAPDEEKYPLFEYYDKFRNMCRKELGFTEIDLPKDKIYLAVVSTKSLPNREKQNLKN